MTPWFVAARWGLVSIALWADPNSVAAIDPKDWTIADIRRGLEALASSWRKREFQYTSMSFAGNGDATKTWRTDTKIKQSADGKFIKETITWRQGVKQYCGKNSWDGKYNLSARYGCDDRDDGDAPPQLTYASVGNCPPMLEMHPEDALNLSCLRKLTVWCELPDSAIMGTGVIDGVPTVRARFHAPIFTSDFPGPHSLELEIAPSRSCWPMRYRLTPHSGNPSKVNDSEIVLSKFQQVDGHWFPHMVIKRWRLGEFESVEETTISEVRFNFPVQESDFRIQIPEGTVVKGLGRLFVWGGARGLLEWDARTGANLETSRREAMAPPTEVSALPQYRASGISWTLAYIGILAMLLLALSRLRSSRKRRSLG